jgi:hypothetical protein
MAADCRCEANPCPNSEHKAGLPCASVMPTIGAHKVPVGWEATSAGLICPSCWIRNDPPIKKAIVIAGTIESEKSKAEI